MNRTCYTTGKWLFFGGSFLALLELSGWAVSQPPPKAEGSTTVEGKIRSFITAPKGEVDGAVLEDGTVLHWPPHLADRVQDMVRRGDNIRVVGRNETAPGGEKHFEVQSLSNLRTQAKLDVAAAPPPPGAPPAPRGDAARVDPKAPQANTLQGRIRSFTTAPKGEVDGALLEDGTVVHWPPHMGTRVRRLIDTGDRIKVVGQTETGPAGDTHFEARSITNLGSSTSIDIGADAPPPPPKR
jgi:hypothetical protein